MKAVLYITGFILYAGFVYGIFALADKWHYRNFYQDENGCWWPKKKKDTEE